MSAWCFEWISAVLMIASLSAFLLLLMAKWKVIEWMQVHGDEYMAKAANCDFCLSWWVNFIVCVVIYVITEEHGMVLVPFFSTIITRKLI